MPNMADSAFNMLSLLMMSNFPDIMLPAYQVNREYCLFFIVYLFIGVFLLMNVLLGITFSIFQENLKKNLNESHE